MISLQILGSVESIIVVNYRTGSYYNDLTTDPRISREHHCVNYRTGSYYNDAHYRS